MTFMQGMIILFYAGVIIAVLMGHAYTRGRRHQIEWTRQVLTEEQARLNADELRRWDT